MLLKGCTTSRRSSPARAAPFFLRERLASVASPSAAFEEALRPTDDLPGVAVRTARSSPSTRVWSLPGAASQTRAEVSGSGLESDASI